MSRYLTPSKIGLLALISLYSDSVVPSAAIVPILSFIVSFLIPTHLSEEEAQRQKSRKVAFPVETLRKATITHVSGIPGRTIWDLVLGKLWAINSADALHTFFDDLSLILEKTHEEPQQGEDQSNGGHRLLLSRTSPCGAFVRRSQLEFTRLQFHDIIEVWKSFTDFREPTFVFWKKRNPDARKGIMTVTLDEGLLDPSSPLVSLLDSMTIGEQDETPKYSADDIEKLMEYQIHQMQSTERSAPPKVVDVLTRSRNEHSIAIGDKDAISQDDSGWSCHPEISTLPRVSRPYDTYFRPSEKYLVF